MKKMSSAVKNIVKMLVLTVVFVDVNSACTFFMHQDKLPETAEQMRIWKD